MNEKYKCDVIGNRSIRLFDGRRVTFFEGDFSVIGNKRLVRIYFYGKKRVSMTKYICVAYSLPLNRRIRKDLIDILINLAER